MATRQEGSSAMTTISQPMFATLTTGLRRQGKFFYLFIAQVLLLVLFPYLDRPGVPTIIFRSLAVLAFVAGVYAVSERRWHRMTALALAILAIVPYSIVTVRPNTRLMGLALLCALIFLAFTLVSLLRAVLRTMEVTHDTIYGSLSVYLLMAMTWGFAYLLLAMFQPTALSMDLLGHSNHSIDWSDCMFYSFVTLTSLGGGLVPVSPQARSLTILENVSGVLYVAVLIARLISAHSASILKRTPLKAEELSRSSKDP
ncbi:MAG: ion channel [Candidatus Acidiferrales bacterium]